MKMSTWQAIAGGTAWMLIAMSISFAALQPALDLAQTLACDEIAPTAVCADGSSNLLMGCASMYL